MAIIGYGSYTPPNPICCQGCHLTDYTGDQIKLVNVRKQDEYSGKSGVKVIYKCNSCMAIFDDDIGSEETFASLYVDNRYVQSSMDLCTVVDNAVRNLRNEIHTERTEIDELQWKTQELESHIKYQVQGAWKSLFEFKLVF